MSPTGNRGKVSHGIGFAILSVTAIQLLFAACLLLPEMLGLKILEPSYNTFINLAILWCHVGWTQLLYLPALGIYFHRHGYKQTRNGVLKTSAALFFITSLCSGMVQL